MTTEALIAWIARLNDKESFQSEVERRLNELQVEQDIIALREDLGLTQSQLAEIAGVSQSFISKIEAGNAKNLELKTLIRTATALGAHVEIQIKADPSLRGKADQHNSPELKKTAAANVSR